MPRAPIFRLPNVSGMAEPLTGSLKPGAAVANGVPVSCNIALAGLQWFRVRFLSTAAGSLKVEFYRAGGTDTVMVIGNPTAATIVANTENKIDVNPHFGEHAAKVTFTPSGNGVVTWAEYEGSSPARR